MKTKKIILKIVAFMVFLAALCFVRNAALALSFLTISPFIFIGLILLSISLFKEKRRNWIYIVLLWIYFFMTVGIICAPLVRELTTKLCNIRMGEISKAMKMYGIEKIHSIQDVETAINLMADQTPKRPDYRLLTTLAHEHYTFEFLADRIIISDKDHSLHCGLKSSCAIIFTDEYLQFSKETQSIPFYLEAIWFYANFYRVLLNKP